MGTIGLLQLCGEVAGTSAKQLSDRLQALEWFVQRLQNLTGTAVKLHMVDLLGGNLPPHKEAVVRTVELPAGPAPRPTTLAELRILDSAPDIHSEQQLMETVQDGPVSLPEERVEADERLLILRIRLEFTLLWIRVQGTKALLADLAPWRNLLPAALYGFLRALDFENRRRYRERQDRFFDTLLNAVPKHPAKVFDNLCKAWQDFGGAQWTWLWIRNDYSNGFELTAACSKEGVNDSGCLPGEGVRPSSGSVADYTTCTNQVVAVDDVEKWTRIHQGQTYRVVLHQEILRLGGRACVSIPLVAPASALRAAMLNTEVTGVVSLHFRDLADMPSVPFPALQRMGQATAQAIVNSFMSGHRDILVKLNQMAEKYLTRVSRRPVEDRKEYLDDLIRLIQDDLHFRMVSVFYRIPFVDAVECLASTGICKRDGDGKVLSADRLSEVMYKPHEGRTGACYAECKPEFHQRNDSDLHSAGISYEQDPETRTAGEPFVVYPIPDSAHAPESRRALGVIRCVDHHKSVASPISSRFLKVELQPLDFIAQQVGPVLQTLESRILRERTISIVKHDLFSPLNMIRDTLYRIEQDVAAGREVREYDVKNLGASHLLASNLVGQLDPDPSQLTAFNPQPIHLEGDILARVVIMLRHFAYEQKRMYIEFDNIRTIPQLNIDRDLVERAIQNLLLNAIKYGNRESTIFIKGRTSRGGYLLDVTNEGLGIEPEEQPFIGVANYRSPRAKHMAMGLGLGLWITRTVMERHQGKLFLTQAKSPTIFTLYFPRALSGSRS